AARHPPALGPLLLNYRPAGMARVVAHRDDRAGGILSAPAELPRGQHLGRLVLDVHDVVTVEDRHRGVDLLGVHDLTLGDAAVLHEPCEVFGDGVVAADAVDDAGKATALSHNEYEVAGRVRARNLGLFSAPKRPYGRGFSGAS